MPDFAPIKSAVNEGLDKADTLPVGAGKLDLFAFARGHDATGTAGIQADYEHHATKTVSLFGTGWAGLDFADRSLNYGVMAGLRWRW